MLVNSYNADVIADNPDIDQIYIYEKAKHAPDKTKSSVWLDNLKVLRKIRKERYDVAIACGSYSPTLARYTFLTGAKVRIGYSREGALNLFYNKPLIPAAGDDHEVERVFNLVKSLGVSGQPGKLILIPGNKELKEAAICKKAAVADHGKPVIAIAVSARIRANKWSPQNFIALIDKILLLDSAHVMLIWAPGSRDNPTFPGDDESSGYIRGHFEGRIMAYPTPSLRSLVAALAVSDIIVTLDTGSLHMAAALGKPTVALMTQGKSTSWYPWKTRSIVLTGKSAVDEVRVDDVLQAVNECIKDFHSIEI